MSPENTTPVETTPAPAETAPAAEPTKAPRNRGPLIAALVAVVIAALAIAGVFLYRNAVDNRNADTEAAFTESVTERGAQVDTVECDGDTCSAIIGGTAYSVLVQENDKGEQQFGVSAFTGE